MVYILPTSLPTSLHDVLPTSLPTGLYYIYIYILPMVYILPTSLHDGYWSFWVMFLPTQKTSVTDRCLGTTSSREDSCFKVQGVHAVTRAFWRQTLTKNMEKKVIFPEEW